MSRGNESKSVQRLKEDVREIDNEPVNEEYSNDPVVGEKDDLGNLYCPECGSDDIEEDASGEMVLVCYQCRDADG